MLGYLLLAIAAALCPVRSDETTDFYVPKNDTASCVNDLVKWCDSMQYPQEGAGMSMVSVSIAEPGGYYRVLCTADHDGTNCTKNGSPWFACSSDNKLYYRGKRLTEGSDEGADDGICQTAKVAFDDLMVQNMSYNNETVKDAMEKGMESFFKGMAEMQEQIEGLKSMLASMFGDGFPFGGYSFGRPIDDEEGTDADEYDRERN